ncbi:MAG: hypothetical protein NkDv07_0712 [Candidatus Improbicoccus devescovinae]|nr:MAG: hypothetical protein NkDv07_0712 [Candidatus Improbicoccus devescovinae]
MPDTRKDKSENTSISEHKKSKSLVASLKKTAGKVVTGVKKLFSGKEVEFKPMNGDKPMDNVTLKGTVLDGTRDAILNELQHQLKAIYVDFKVKPTLGSDKIKLYRKVNNEWLGTGDAEIEFDNKVTQIGYEIGGDSVTVVYRYHKGKVVSKFPWVKNKDVSGIKRFLAEAGQDAKVYIIDTTVGKRVKKPIFLGGKKITNEAGKLEVDWDILKRLHIALPLPLVFVVADEEPKTIRRSSFRIGNEKQQAYKKEEARLLAAPDEELEPMDTDPLPGVGDPTAAQNQPNETAPANPTADAGTNSENEEEQKAAEARKAEEEKKKNEQATLLAKVPAPGSDVNRDAVHASRVAAYNALVTKAKEGTLTQTDVEHYLVQYEPRSEAAKYLIPTQPDPVELQPSEVINCFWNYIYNNNMVKYFTNENELQIGWDISPDVEARSLGHKFYSETLEKILDKPEDHMTQSSVNEIATLFASIIYGQKILVQSKFLLYWSMIASNKKSTDTSGGYHELTSSQKAVLTNMVIIVTDKMFDLVTKSKITKIGSIRILRDSFDEFAQKMAEKMAQKTLKDTKSENKLYKAFSSRSETLEVTSTTAPASLLYNADKAADRIKKLDLIYAKATNGSSGWAYRLGRGNLALSDVCDAILKDAPVHSDKAISRQEKDILISWLDTAISFVLDSVSLCELFAFYDEVQSGFIIARIHEKSKLEEIIAKKKLVCTNRAAYDHEKQRREIIENALKTGSTKKIQNATIKEADVEKIMNALESNAKTTYTKAFNDSREEIKKNMNNMKSLDAPEKTRQALLQICDSIISILSPKQNAGTPTKANRPKRAKDDWYVSKKKVSDLGVKNEPKKSAEAPRDGSSVTQTSAPLTSISSPSRRTMASFTSGRRLPSDISTSTPTASGSASTPPSPSSSPASSTPSSGPSDPPPAGVPSPVVTSDEIKVKFWWNPDWTPRLSDDGKFISSIIEGDKNMKLYELINKAKSGMDGNKKWGTETGPMGWTAYYLAGVALKKDTKKFLLSLWDENKTIGEIKEHLDANRNKYFMIVKHKIYSTFINPIDPGTEHNIIPANVSDIK